MQLAACSLRLAVRGAPPHLLSSDRAQQVVSQVFHQALHMEEVVHLQVAQVAPGRDHHQLLLAAHRQLIFWDAGRRRLEGEAAHLRRMRELRHMPRHESRIRGTQVRLARAMADADYGTHAPVGEELVPV